MRPLRALALLLASSLGLGGCFSSGSNLRDGGPPAVGDASSGGQGVGTACDPSSATPCLATGDECLGVYCDPYALVCTQYVTDAGPPCNGGSVACATTADCDVGLVCGFPAGGGCGAAGQCIDVAIACENDAAACPTGGTACGCSGEPVSFIIPGYATGPTPIPSATTSQGGCAPDGGAADAGSATDGGDASVGP